MCNTVVLNFKTHRCCFWPRKVLAAATMWNPRRPKSSHLTEPRSVDLGAKWRRYFENLKMMTKRNKTVHDDKVEWLFFICIAVHSKAKSAEYLHCIVLGLQWTAVRTTWLSSRLVKTSGLLCVSSGPDVHVHGNINQQQWYNELYYFSCMSSEVRSAIKLHEDDAQNNCLFSARWVFLNSYFFNSQVMNDILHRSTTLASGLSLLIHLSWDAKKLVFILVIKSGQKCFHI